MSFIDKLFNKPEEKEEKIIREKIRNNLCGMGSFYLPDLHFVRRLVRILNYENQFKM